LIVDLARKRAHREELQVHGATMALMVANAGDCGANFRVNA
jgi:hypothetical protein